CPKRTSIGVVINSRSLRAEAKNQPLLASSQSLGLKLEIGKVSSAIDLETAFAAMMKAGAAAVFIASDPSYTAFHDQIALWAVRHGLPTMFSSRAAVVAGAHVLRLQHRGFLPSGRRLR